MTHVSAQTLGETIVRMARPESDALLKLLFSRYPEHEWASFARFGWRATSDSLILTLASLDAPETGDLDEMVGHVAIQEPYTLRMALQAEKQPFGVGVIHSHPKNCRPKPSRIDDDMDTYYAGYFGDFAPGRPYVSLIGSQINSQVVFSGRVFWRGTWHAVNRFVIQGHPSCTFREEEVSPTVRTDKSRARLRAAFGEIAEKRLRQSTAAVIGAGGTGSMAIEVLARAGVGRIIIVDPDHLEPSNLERVHGSTSADVTGRVPKAEVAARHVKSIDPTCEIRAVVGSLPQSEVVDAIVGADVAIGCTDQQHSRLALSDICVRYLLSSIDCGVMIEGSGGAVTGQVIQLVRFHPSDPCVLCRNMTSPRRIATELMSEVERENRRRAAREAAERGEDPDPYWSGIPQLNTVGYLTGIAGAFAAAYAVGWLTGRFDPPFERLQMNILAPMFDVQEPDDGARPTCACRRMRGSADQGLAEALISAPSHWPAVRRAF